MSRKSQEKNAVFNLEDDELYGQWLEFYRNATRPKTKAQAKYKSLLDELNKLNSKILAFAALESDTHRLESLPFTKSMVTKRKEQISDQKDKIQQARERVKWITDEKLLENAKNELRKQIANLELHPVDGFEAWRKKRVVIQPPGNIPQNDDDSSESKNTVKNPNEPTTQLIPDTYVHPPYKDGRTFIPQYSDEELEAEHHDFIFASLDAIDNYLAEHSSDAPHGGCHRIWLNCISVLSQDAEQQKDWQEEKYEDKHRKEVKKHHNSLQYLTDAIKFLGDSTQQFRDLLEQLKTAIETNNAELNQSFIIDLQHRLTCYRLQREFITSLQLGFKQYKYATKGVVSDPNWWQRCARILRNYQESHRHWQEFRVVHFPDQPVQTFRPYDPYTNDNLLVNAAQYFNRSTIPGKLVFPPATLDKWMEDIASTSCYVVTVETKTRPKTPGVESKGKSHRTSLLSMPTPIVVNKFRAPNTPSSTVFEQSATTPTSQTSPTTDEKITTDNKAKPQELPQSIKAIKTYFDGMKKINYKTYLVEHSAWIHFFKNYQLQVKAAEEKNSAESANNPPIIIKLEDDLSLFINRFTGFFGDSPFATLLRNFENELTTANAIGQTLDITQEPTASYLASQSKLGELFTDVNGYFVNIPKSSNKTQQLKDWLYINKFIQLQLSKIQYDAKTANPQDDQIELRKTQIRQRLEKSIRAFGGVYGQALHNLCDGGFLSNRTDYDADFAALSQTLQSELQPHTNFYLHAFDNIVLYFQQRRLETQSGNARRFSEEDLIARRQNWGYLVAFIRNNREKVNAKQIIIDELKVAKSRFTKTFGRQQYANHLGELIKALENGQIFLDDPQLETYLTNLSKHYPVNNPPADVKENKTSFPSTSITPPPTIQAIEDYFNNRRKLYDATYHQQRALWLKFLASYKTDPRIDILNTLINNNSSLNDTDIVPIGSTLDNLFSNLKKTLEDEQNAVSQPVKHYLVSSAVLPKLVTEVDHYFTSTAVSLDQTQRHRDWLYLRKFILEQLRNAETHLDITIAKNAIQQRLTRSIHKFSSHFGSQRYANALQHLSNAFDSINTLQESSLNEHSQLYEHLRISLQPHQDRYLQAFSDIDKSIATKAKVFSETKTYTKDDEQLLMEQHEFWLNALLNLQQRIKFKKDIIEKYKGLNGSSTPSITLLNEDSKPPPLRTTEFKSSGLVLQRQNNLLTLYLPNFPSLGNIEKISLPLGGRNRAESIYYKLKELIPLEPGSCQNPELMSAILSQYMDAHIKTEILKQLRPYLESPGWKNRQSREQLTTLITSIENNELFLDDALNSYLKTQISLYKKTSTLSSLKVFDQIEACINAPEDIAISKRLMSDWIMILMSIQQSEQNGLITLKKIREQCDPNCAKSVDFQQLLAQLELAIKNGHFRRDNNFIELITAQLKYNQTQLEILNTIRLCNPLKSDSKNVVDSGQIYRLLPTYEQNYGNYLTIRHQHGFSPNPYGPISAVDAVLNQRGNIGVLQNITVSVELNAGSLQHNSVFDSYCRNRKYSAPLANTNSSSPNSDVKRRHSAVDLLPSTAPSIAPASFAPSKKAADNMPFYEHVHTLRNKIEPYAQEKREAVKSKCCNFFNIDDTRATQGESIIQAIDKFLLGQYEDQPKELLQFTLNMLNVDDQVTATASSAKTGLKAFLDEFMIKSFPLLGETAQKTILNACEDLSFKDTLEKLVEQQTQPPVNPQSVVECK